MKVTQLVGSPVLLGGGASVYLVAAGTHLTPPRHLGGSGLLLAHSCQGSGGHAQTWVPLAHPGRH